MPMYNLIEYSDIYSKSSESLWQYYRDEPTLNNAGDIVGFPANDNNISLYYDGTKNVEIMVPLNT